MKTSMKKRIFAGVMAFLMVVGLLPLSSLNKPVDAKAADAKVYVFESKDLTAFAAETHADSDTISAGTDNFFTLYVSAKTKVDSSPKTWDDGYTSDQRLNFGGKADVANLKNVVAFTTERKATVKIWWVEGGDDARQMAIYKADGTEVAVTAQEAPAKNKPYLSSHI